jgi:Na+/H+-dicarboxylate symporter
MKLTGKIIISLIAGAVVGLLLNLFAPELLKVLVPYFFTPLGSIFLNLIKMLVVPIVFFSIVLGSAGLGDPKKLGRIGFKTIGYYLTTTTIAIIIGLALASVIQPGSVGSFDTESAEFSAEKAPPVGETLMNIIPTNPIAAMAEGNMLQIIAFAIFIGIALTALGDKTKWIFKFVEQGNDIMMYLVGLVMKFALWNIWFDCICHR